MICICPKLFAVDCFEGETAEEEEENRSFFSGTLRFRRKMTSSRRHLSAEKKAEERFARLTVTQPVG